VWIHIQSNTKNIVTGTVVLCYLIVQ
jgi:hypothetical protein